MKIKKTIKNIYVHKQIKKEQEKESRLCWELADSGKRTPLDSGEIDSIKKYWGIDGSKCLIGEKELEVIKYFNGFDKRYISHGMYLPMVARKLNNYHYTKFYENKGIVDRFDKNIPFPKCVVRRIDGEFYDEHMHQISLDEAENICKNVDFDVILKPSVGSSGGKGIVKTGRSKDSNWYKMLKDYEWNFIVQKCITQGDETALFNKDSVNTTRITTMYLNGKFSVCSIAFRYGNKGSVTDNFGSGGNIVGVHEDGSLYDYAISRSLDKLYEVNGVKIKDLKLSFIPDALELVKKWHMDSFSLCKFIGWDVCVDADGNCVILEINSSQPGVFMEQLVTGPIFGDRTQEVIDYIKGKEFRYGKSVFNY